MFDDSQVKLLQQRQKIRMFYGLPAQVAETVNQWVDKTQVYVVNQKIEVIEHNILVSILYVSNVKPTTSTGQTSALPTTKGQHPILNMEAIKAAYEQG